MYKHFFLSLMIYSCTMAHALEIKRPTQERINKAQEVIISDHAHNKLVRSSIINGLKVVGIATIVYGIHLAKLNRSEPEALARLMDEKTRRLWLENGVALLWGNDNKKSSNIRLMKRVVHWFKDAAKSVVPTFILSKLFYHVLDVFGDVFARRDAHWFVMRCTSINQLIRQLKLIAATRNPNSSIFQALNATHMPVDATKEKTIINEIIQLRAYALAAQSIVDTQQLDREFVYILNLLVPEIERFAAFIQFYIPDSEFAQNLIQATNCFCDYVQQFFSDNQDIDLLAVLFNYSVQLERIIVQVQLSKRQMSNQK